MLPTVSAAERDAPPLASRVVLLFDAHAAGLCRLASAMLHDADAAQDVVQDTFVKLIAHLAAGGALPNARGWLDTVAAHGCRDRQRRSWRWLPYEVVLPDGSDPGASQLLPLSRARALVTAADARLVAFSAAGQMAGRPVAIDFTLTGREVRAANSVTDADFDVPVRPGDIVLSGAASSSPAWDVLERALAAIPQPATR